jgi:hypothetical protein
VGARRSCSSTSPLLVPTEPHVGLTAEDVAMLEGWAQAQRERATVVHRSSPYVTTSPRSSTTRSARKSPAS